MYVITGATGNIGSKLAEILLSRGQKVRVIGRSADKLAAFAKKGAEVAAGSLDDGAFLAGAFAQAKGVFAMLPPKPGAADYHKENERTGEIIASALSQAKVPVVVNLSSVGAHLPQGGGVVEPLHHQEKRLDQKLPAAHVAHLRATYFLENMMRYPAMIKQMGMMGSPLRGDLTFNMIATADIAEAAARHLIDAGPPGHKVHFLLGQRDVTYNEIARLIGKAIGRDDLKYVQFPYEDAKKAMLGMGMGASFTDALIEFTKSINDGKVFEGAVRSAETTTKTTPEKFIEQVFVPAFKSLG